MNFLLVYCKDCFDHIHDYVIEVLAASVHAEFKTKYVGVGAAVEYAVLNLKKNYKEELLKIKQKLAEASGTSLEDIQVPLTVQMSIFIDKKKKRGGLGCSSNVGSSHMLHLLVHPWKKCICFEDR